MGERENKRGEQGQAERMLVVGIGASAGGLEALKRFFNHLPEKTGMVYVVVMHLDPEQPSILADLLQPHSKLPVHQVKQDLELQADHVYVIPPGSNLDSIGSHLRLSRIEPQRLQRAPIDHFFSTLAQNWQDRCAGIVLSGTGSDGTFGIRRIKQQGGLTLAQVPKEAGFDGMPRSAIATDMIDLVLPVEEMFGQLHRFARCSPALDVDRRDGGLSDSDNRHLQQILNRIRTRKGRDFTQYKHSTVLRRVRRRMQLLDVEGLEDYLAFIRDNPNEAYLLAEEFLITVTQFFRDSKTFAHLEREVLPKLFAGKQPEDSVRVWSVGCATGEEAYSLAMLLLEQVSGPRLEIFATDLHEASLQYARDGIYPDTIESDVSQTRLRCFFRKEDSHYTVRKELRENIVFAVHDLLRDPPFSRLDLIVCRNLLIYLKRDAQKNVIDLFHYALKPGGQLLLGPSETIDRNGLFEMEHKHHCLYRRRNVPPPEPRMPVFPRLFASGGAESRPVTSESSPRGYGGLHQRMVERYALPSILVDQDYRIVHSSEHAGRYLQVPGGELTSSVFKLAREELVFDLRSALHAALEHGSDSRSDPILLTINGQPRQVILHVRQAKQPDLSGLCLVTFDEMTASANAGKAQADPQLEQTRERLRAVIEQYETSQEEMRAANEELQSTNEELRSTMEELETSKEELQSMNEELQTVNQENRNRVDELSQLTSDLNNLMAATDIATLFLDRKLCIQRVTPRAKSLFNVRSSDLGRPFTELRHRLGYDNFQQDALQVLDHLAPLEREVLSDAGEWYLTRVLPYRSTADQIQGVVITLVDITRQKNSELALRNSEERYRALVTASAQIVWNTDAQGRKMEDSPSWRAFTGQTREQWLSEVGWLEAVHPDDRQQAAENWRRCIEEIRPVDIELRLQHVSGDWRWTHVRAVPLRDEQERVRGWVGMNTDIDDRKRAEEALRQSDRRKDEYLAFLAHELRNPLAPLRTANEILKQRMPDDAEIRKVHTINERQISHLCHLVDDLLDVARIKTNRVKLQFARLDLRDLVRNAAANSDQAIADKSLRLTLDPGEEPLPIEGDEVRLIQVINNLLDNAIKYTAPGGALQIVTQREDKEVILRLRDNGDGMNEELRGRVFELFERGTEKLAAQVSGLGVGLTLVKRLTEMHGGTVEAVSGGPGRGSEFILRLPLVDPLAVELRAPSTAGRRGNPSGERTPSARKRVLVVDDNRDAADSLTLMLEILGHEVRTAADARAALATACEFSPQVVVLDIGLPDMDGYALADELRKREATASALLIAATGYGQEGDRARSEASGIDHHLVKPVDTQLIRELLEQAVPDNRLSEVQDGDGER
jgi:two-component system, chemotaxis family, CheB/CheR fusion protein